MSAASRDRRSLVLAAFALGASCVPSAEQPALGSSSSVGASATVSASASPAAIVSASARPMAVASTAPAAPPGPPEVVIDPAPSAKGAPAALYADLFSPGAKWEIRARYRVASNKSTPSERRTDGKGECSVVAVERHPWALVSHIDCRDLDAEGALSDPFSGYWAATAVGLFYFAEDPGPAPPPLTRSRLVLTASPAPEKLEQNDPGYRFGPVWFSHVTREGNAWCSSDGSASGDATQRRRCITANRGFTAGGATAIVGMTAYSVDLDVKRFVDGRRPPEPAP